MEGPRNQRRLGQQQRLGNEGMATGGRDQQQGHGDMGCLGAQSTQVHE